MINFGILAAAGVVVLTENLNCSDHCGLNFGCYFLWLTHGRKIGIVFVCLVVGGLIAGQILGKAFWSPAGTSVYRNFLGGPENTPKAELSRQCRDFWQSEVRIFRKGLGGSAQKMVIPEPQNDMILSIICEELGVFGLIVVLVLFGMLLYRLMFIAQNAPDLYGSLIVTGVFAHIAIQVLLNVAVVLNVIPTTGITLPFISYGGTSAVFLMIAMGIVLNVSGKIKIRQIKFPFLSSWFVL